MVAYSYNENTGEYEGEVECQPSPLEKGKFLIPAHATTTKPPTCTPQEVPVFRQNSWQKVPDFRKEKYWNTETKKEVQITKIGEMPKDCLTTKPPITDTAENTFACVYNDTKDDWEVSTTKLQELKDTKKKGLRRQIFETKMKIDKAAEYDMADILQEEEEKLVSLNKDISKLEEK